MLWLRVAEPPDYGARTKLIAASGRASSLYRCESVWSVKQKKTNIYIYIYTKQGPYKYAKAVKLRPPHYSSSASSANMFVNNLLTKNKNQQGPGLMARALRGPGPGPSVVLGDVFNNLNA